MFFFRHPRPVIDGRTHAVQVVQREAAREVSRTLLIVDSPSWEGKTPPAAPEQDPAPPRGHG